MLRHEDWDEDLEWLKSYAMCDWVIRAQAVRPLWWLAGDIGHGTIVGRYVNNVDLNTFAAQFDVNTKWGGFEGLSATSMTSVETPQATNSCVAHVLKALRLGDEKLLLLNRLRVGINWAADVNAPMTPGVSETHGPDRRRPGGRLQVNTDIQVFENPLITIALRQLLLRPRRMGSSRRGSTS